MTNMVVVPSSDSEDEPAGGRNWRRAPPAKKAKRKAGCSGASGLEAPRSKTAGLTAADFHCGSRHGMEKVLTSGDAEALPDDGILADSAPPIKEPVHQEDILNMEMLRESAVRLAFSARSQSSFIGDAQSQSKQRGVQKPTSRIRQKLPFESFRDETGKLFGRSYDAGRPAHDLMLSTLRFPVHLGTFKLDLGKVRLLPASHCLEAG